MSNKIFQAIILIALIFPNPAFADPVKTILLKDGSTVKGEIVKFENSVYTVKTESLGNIQISDSKILSIHSGQNSVQQNAFPASGLPDIQELQKNIISDENVMSEIENLIGDPEIMKLLSDPKLMNDVMSYDPEKIKNNATATELMKNPKIMGLINKIGNKYNAQK